jgi:hypothetical protein
MDVALLINLTFCVVIIVLGYIGYRKIGKIWPLFISISFGFYGLSHLLSLIGISDTWEPLLIVIRILGYLGTIYALYLGIFKEQEAIKSK